MLVRREFDPATAQKLESIPIEKLHQFLGIDPMEKGQKPSKWEKVARKIEGTEISDETIKHIRKCSEEFREGFAFKHDLIEKE